MMNTAPNAFGISGARVALCAANGTTLVDCARYAERSGLRVVTMVEKDEDSAGLGGAQLYALVGRLGNGEFDVIVADAGNGRVVEITGVSLDDHQGVAVLNCAESNNTKNVEELEPTRAMGARSRGAIYVRCGSPPEASPYPLAEQWDPCEAYAAHHGWKTVHVYKDNIGIGPLSRCSFDKMMSEAARGAFDVILVRDLNRLGHDNSRVVRLVADLKSLGIAVHSVTGGERVAWEASVRHLMAKRSIKESTKKKGRSWIRQRRSSSKQPANQQVAL